MNITKSASIILSALVLLSCETEIEKNTAEKKENTPSIVAGSLYVQFDDSLMDSVENTMTKSPHAEAIDFIDDIFPAFTVTSVERLYPDAGKFEARHREAGLHRWYIVKYDEASVIESKANEPVKGVMTMKPARRVKSFAANPVFNDPKLISQWQYYNDGSKDGWKSGADINIVPVWTQFTGGSKDVIVSVVDGGIDINHEDLKDAVVPPGENGSRNFLQLNYEVSAHPHGTHVAGSIGAINNNGIGVSGVAGGLDGTGGVRLLSCEVFQGDEDTPDEVIPQAIVWGADHGAVISNNSWGYAFETEEEAAECEVGIMKDAIDYFIKYAGIDEKGNQVGPMKGGVMFFSAGNDGWKYGLPASYEGDGKCIAVGASTSMNTRASYSNYGEWVDIAAPGGDWISGANILSTYPNNEYFSLIGTSMACPHVSGVAALIVSYFGGPGFTNDMLVERLLGGANPDALPAGSEIGPMLDAYGAFVYGGVAPQKVTSFEAEGAGGTIKMKWKVNGSSDNEPAYRYLLLASPNKEDFENLDCRNLPSSMTSTEVLVNGKAIGEEMSDIIRKLSFNTTYYVAITGADYLKHYAPLSEIKEIKTTENHAPVIETSYTGNWNFRSSEKADIEIQINDADGHSMTFGFESDCSAAKSYKKSYGIYTLEINASDAMPGNYSFTYSATDEYGLKTVMKQDFVILDNVAPVAHNATHDIMIDRLGAMADLDLAQFFYDEDGDKLSYSADKPAVGIVSSTLKDGRLSISALAYGTDKITVRAKDSKSAEAVMTVRICVINPDAPITVYPTQVKDYLYVSGGLTKEIDISILNSTGKNILSTSAVSSAFEPAEIDMKRFSPGIYKVKVTLDGKSSSHTVVKL